MCMCVCVCKIRSMVHLCTSNPNFNALKRRRVHAPLPPSPPHTHSHSCAHSRVRRRELHKTEMKRKGIKGLVEDWGATGYAKLVENTTSDVSSRTKKESEGKAKDLPSKRSWVDLEKYAEEDER